MDNNENKISLRNRDVKSYGLLYNWLSERAQRRRVLRLARRRASEARNDALRGMINRDKKGGSIA